MSNLDSESSKSISEEADVIAAKIQSQVNKFPEILEDFEKKRPKWGWEITC